MQSPKCPTMSSRTSLPFKGGVRLPHYRSVTVVTVLLFSLALLCPLCRAGTESPPTPISGLPVEDWWRQIPVLMVVALGFGWLKILTDFKQYRGLLLALLLNGYSWVFVVFIASLSFVFDYFAITHGVSHIPLGHVYLVLGHIGVSALFANFVPLLVAKIRFLHPTHDPSVEKRPTEMNVVFGAIRETLDGHTNGRLTSWARKYTWDHLKYVAHTMRIDHVNSKQITADESARWESEIDGYKSCDKQLEDQQKKYELLRRMMTHSSFSDLRMRLKQTEQVSLKDQINERRDELPPTT